METRIGKLEATVGHIESDIKEIKSDVRDLRDRQWSHFIIIFGAMIAATLGLAWLMAHGFKWI